MFFFDAQIHATIVSEDKFFEKLDEHSEDLQELVATNLGITVPLTYRISGFGRMKTMSATGTLFEKNFVPRFGVLLFLLVRIPKITQRIQIKTG